MRWAKTACDIGSYTSSHWRLRSMWASMPPASPMTDGRGGLNLCRIQNGTSPNYGVAIVAVLLIHLAVRACVGRPICSQEGNRGGHSRLMPGCLYDHRGD